MQSKAKPQKRLRALAKVIPFRPRQPHFSTIFIPIDCAERELARAAVLSTAADHTPEGRAIARSAERIVGTVDIPAGARLVSFTPSVFMSGIDFDDGGMLRKGSLEPITKWLEEMGGIVQKNVPHIVSGIRNQGDRAAVVADETRVLGVIALRRTPRR